MGVRGETRIATRSSQAPNEGTAEVPPQQPRHSTVSSAPPTEQCRPPHRTDVSGRGHERVPPAHGGGATPPPRTPPSPHAPLDRTRRTTQPGRSGWARATPPTDESSRRPRRRPDLGCQPTSAAVSLPMPAWTIRGRLPAIGQGVVRDVLMLLLHVSYSQAGFKLTHE